MAADGGPSQTPPPPTSERTSRPELPRGLFFSARFCSLKQGIRKECEEVLIIDGGAAALAVGVGEGRGGGVPVWKVWCH